MQTRWIDQRRRTGAAPGFRIEPEDAAADELIDVVRDAEGLGAADVLSRFRAESVKAKSPKGFGQSLVARLIRRGPQPGSKAGIGALLWAHGCGHQGAGDEQWKKTGHDRSRDPTTLVSFSS